MRPDLDPLWRFFEQGGPITWAILAASVLMWTLILERYWYYLASLHGERRRLDLRWRQMRLGTRKARDSLRNTLIAAQGLRMRRSLGSIRSLTGALPLLGLLGTVSGMIDSFQVLAEFGQGNARGLAGGISQALFTTMAGLITALSGYFFSVDLDARARAEERRLRHQLK